MKNGFLGFAIIFLFSIIGFSSGLFVQLSTNSQILISNTTGNLNISATINEINSGTDTARQTIATLWTDEPGLVFSSSTIGDLGPNQTYSGIIYATGKPNLENGTWPAYVLTSYKDQNGVIFSSVTPWVFNIGQTENNEISIKTNPISINENESGNLKVVFYNLADKPLNVNITMVLPFEFASNGSSLVNVQTQINAKQSYELNLPIEAFTAIAPSSYVIAIFAQTEQNGIEQTNLSKTIINITESSPYFLYYSLAILAITVGIIIVYYLISKKGKKNGKQEKQ